MGSTKFSGQIRFYFREWNFVIAVPTKCGTSAIKQFIWMHEADAEPVSLNEMRSLSCEKYAVIRNPYDRFASLWKSKCRDKMPIRDKSIHGLAPRELMTHISSGKKDVHWTPQVEFFRGVEGIKLIPLENLNSWWESYGKLEAFNSTDGDMPMDEAIDVWLQEFYAEDFILYSKACGFD